MISPHTAPGTRVVCVNNDTVESVLAIGRGYIVAEILIRPVLFGLLQIPLVSVHGVKCPCGGDHLAFFLLDCFDYAELPKAITSLLQTTPVDAPEKVEG